MNSPAVQGLAWVVMLLGVAVGAIIAAGAETGLPALALVWLGILAAVLQTAQRFLPRLHEPPDGG